MKSVIKIFSRMFALAMLLSTFSANAWVYPATNQTDIDLAAYYTSLYKLDNNLVGVEFFNETEHLAMVGVDSGESPPPKIHIHSNKKKIGGSYWEGFNIKYNLICPDGQTATVKRHIALAKTIFVPNRTYPACAVPPPPPPANKTSISTIQALYGSNYTVTRMFTNRDIFKVTCTVYPACYMDGGPIYGDLPSWGVTYYSNTQKIAHRANLVSWNFIAVRSKDTVTSQTAKDDLDILAGLGFDSNPWMWVDYTWEEKWIAWFTHYE
jgi:hypothetical protein